MLNAEQQSVGYRQYLLTWTFRLAYYAVLVAIVTWPLIFHLSDRLLGHPDVDVWNHIWGFRWFHEMLIERHELPLFTRDLAWPRGGKLYFIDPINALLSVPLQEVFGLATSFNLVVMGEAMLGGLATHLLAREAGAGERGAFAAGSLMITSPIVRCEMHNGITEVGNYGWIALSLWMLLRALHTGRLRYTAAAGFLCALSFVACWYWGMAAGAASVLLVLLFWPRRRGATPLARGNIIQFVTHAFTWTLSAALIAVPTWMAFRWTLQGPDALIQRAPGQSFFLLRHNATDLLSFIRPGGVFKPDLWTLYGERFLHTTYLGWTAIILAGLGLRHRNGIRSWGWIALSFAILALGPYLYVDGEFFTLGTKIIKLPFALIFNGLDIVAITHPARMVIITLISLAVMLALAVDDAAKPSAYRRWLPLVIVAVVLEGLISGAAPWPLTLAPATHGDCVERLARDPAPGAVLDVPGLYLNTMRTSRYLYAQTRHGRPVPYGVTVRPETAAGFIHDKLYRWILLLGMENDPGIVRALKQESPKRLERDFQAQFLANGYRYIVLHRDILQPPYGIWPYRYLFDMLIGEPESTPDGCWIYRIPPEMSAPFERIRPERRR